MEFVQNQNLAMIDQNFDDSTIQINDTLTVAENNSSALTTAVTNASKNNQKMFLSSKLENFKIEVGPKVIEACSILRNVSTFTSDNYPIEVEMSKKQLKKFVKLHEHFGEDDPWDKEDPYWTNKFFLKMSENEFKQLCWSADFLDSKRFLHSAAIYILSKIRDMEVEDIQKYLNIVSDYTEDEKNAIENDPLKYFASIALGKYNHDLQIPGENVHKINPNFTTNLFPLKNHYSKMVADFNNLQRRQNFTFPHSLIQYTFTTFLIPTDPSFIYILYSTCKFFYAKLKIIPCTTISVGKWQTENIYVLYDNENSIYLPPEAFKNLNGDFYPISNLSVGQMCSQETFYNVLKKIIPQKINSILIFNKNLVLTVKEFKILFLNVTCVTLCLDVVDENGDTVPLEEILNYLPNVQNFKYEPANSECYTSKTTKIIAALKRNVKFNNFKLHYPPPNELNASDFAEFVKNQIHPSYMGTIHLVFENSIDTEIISNFYSIVLKEIDTWKLPSMKPILMCGNSDDEILFNSKPFPNVFWPQP